MRDPRRTILLLVALLGALIPMACTGKDPGEHAELQNDSGEADSNETNLLQYDLEIESELIADSKILGVAADDDRIWVAYADSVGEPNEYLSDVRIVQYDKATWETDATLYLVEPVFAASIGLSWDGAHFWTTSGGTVDQVDSGTGEIIKTFKIDDRFSDLSWEDDHLVIGFEYEILEWIEPAKGTLDERIRLPYCDQFGLVGVAYRPGEYWVGCNIEKRLSVFDKTGKLIGEASLEHLPLKIRSLSNLTLAFAGEHLLLASETDGIRTIYQLNVEAN